MSIAEVYHIIIKASTLLKSHLLILSENDDITTNEEWQKYLIKEIQETVIQIKESCDYIVNTNNIEMAQQMISLNKDINAIMSCYKAKFTENTRFGYALNIFAFKANMRFILQYFKIKGIDINQQWLNIENSKDILDLQTPLNTDRARKYFKRALECGFIKLSGNGYKWVYGDDKGQVRLGYFCYKTFEAPRPINYLEELFRVRKLSASISNASTEAIRADVIAWRKEIDCKIFFD